MLASAALFSVWLFVGFVLSAYAVKASVHVGLFLGILSLQAATAAAIFYTASKVTLHRYEVVFEERLRVQVQEMNRRIDEMKDIVKQIDAAFRERSQTLTEEVAAAVREVLAREQSVT
jgi:vacuolar-type H+-ATPase subunit I/STV1